MVNIERDRHNGILAVLTDIVSVEVFLIFGCYRSSDYIDSLRGGTIETQFADRCSCSCIY